MCVLGVWTGGVGKACDISSRGFHEPRHHPWVEISGATQLYCVSARGWPLLLLDSVTLDCQGASEPWFSCLVRWRYFCLVGLF